jgi:hypothetical protein
MALTRHSVSWYDELVEKMALTRHSQITVVLRRGEDDQSTSHNCSRRNDPLQLSNMRLIAFEATGIL